jgi:phosphatidylserine/phosphatidylglycerophosphate/cardiolipin synthase-like enzyme
MRFVSGRGHYDTVIDAVQKARTSVWIATANLKELMVEDRRWSLRRRRRGAISYRSVIQVFDELITAGVEIRLMHAAPPSRPFRAELARHQGLAVSGAATAAPVHAAGTLRGRFEMRLCPRVHLKAVIVDGEFLYLGSANWTGAGLGVKGVGRRNFELGMVTDDALLLDDVQEIFDRIWRGAECAACKLRDVCPRPLDIARVSRRKRAHPSPPSPGGTGAIPRM